MPADRSNRLSTLAVAIHSRLPLPLSTVLVIVGLAAATAFPLLRQLVTPDLLLSVLIPGLVFAAAYAIDWSDLRPVLMALVGLAIPGVLFSALVVAVLLHLTIGLPFELALVVGAITAATDPVAVVAAMAGLSVPTRLRTLVEGESLLNDGTGLVLFALAVRSAEGGLEAGQALGLFVGTIAASVASGVLGGLIAARLARTTSRRSLQVVLTAVLAYGSYLVADGVGLSGILATVIGAITLGSRMRQDPALGQRVSEVESLWAWFAAALTSLTFLLIGVAIAPNALIGVATAILVGTLGVVGARATLVYLPAWLSTLRKDARGAPRGWAHVLIWAGLRGAVALAAALSIPEGFPERTSLQQISFGIILATLLVQGGTAPWVVRWALGQRTASTGSD